MSKVYCGYEDLPKALAVEAIPVLQAPTSTITPTIQNDKHGNYARPNWPACNEESCRTFLSSHDWPTGLQEALIKNLLKVPIRFIICDDSGSMMRNDGKKVKKFGSGSSALVPCSR